MREPGVQRDGKKKPRSRSKLIVPPTVMANKRRAPVAILSPAKRIGHHRVFQ